MAKRKTPDLDAHAKKQKYAEDMLADRTRVIAATMMRMAAGGASLNSGILNHIMDFAIALHEVNQCEGTLPFVAIQKALRDRDWRVGHPDFPEYADERRKAAFRRDPMVQAERLKRDIVKHALRVTAAELEQSSTQEANANNALLDALDKWVEFEIKRRAGGL